jgi:hypothetical protein
LPLSNPGATGWKGQRERRSSGYLSGWVAKRLGAFVAAIGEGVATARHPRPGTQSISALPRRVECDASDGLRAVETGASRSSQSHRNRTCHSCEAGIALLRSGSLLSQDDGEQDAVPRAEYLALRSWSRRRCRRSGLG